MPDIRLPNGKLIRGVPEGVSKDQVMRKAIAAGLATEADFGMQPAQAAEPSVPPTTPSSEGRPSLFERYVSTMRSIPETVTEAVQNVATLGQAPKLRAIEAAVGPETYEQALAREEAERARIKEESPFIYGAAQAAAPLALAPLTGGATLPMAGGRFLAQGVAIPAAEGAILGATQAAEQQQDMGAGAAMGGLLGGALGPIGYGIGSLVAGAANRFFGPDKASRIVKESLDENIEPDEAIERLRAGGQDYMIADLVPEVAYQVQAAPGVARQRIRGALEQRQRGDVVTGLGGQKEQFKNIMNDFTGRYDENFYTKLRNLRKQKSEKSKEAYNKAFEDTIEPTEDMIAIVDTPLGKQAFNSAKRSWQNEMITDDFPFEDPSGLVYPEGITDLKFWNNFKKELDQLADYTPAGQKIFKKVDRSPDNVNASEMANVIRGELKYQSDAYENALEKNREFQQMDEGMRLGKDIYRMRTDEIEDKMANLTVPKDAVKMGIIQSVKEQVQQMMDTGSVGRKVTRNDNFKAVLKQIIPDKNEYAKFINQIQRLEDQAYTYARVTRTVPTAENIRSIIQAEGSQSPLAELANLNLGAAIRSGLGMVGRPTLPREEIADILLQQGPQAMQTLQQLYTPTPLLQGAPGLLGMGFGALGTQPMLQQ